MLSIKPSTSSALPYKAVAIPAKDRDAARCLPTRFVRGPSAAAAIALINAIGSTGGFFGPSLVGLSRNFGGGDTAAFYTLATLALVGCVWFIALRRIKSFQRGAGPANVELGERSVVQQAT